MGLTGDTVVISNGEDVYIWKPEKTSYNTKKERARSFIKSLSEAASSLRLKVDEYAPRQKNCLWIDPQGLSPEVKEGCIAKLKKNVPVKLRSTSGEIQTRMEFKYRLTRPGTVNAIICSEGYCSTRKAMKDETVSISYDEELIEEQVRAKKNPLNPETF